MTTVVTPQLARVHAFVLAECTSYDPSGDAAKAMQTDYMNMLSRDVPAVNVCEGLLQGVLQILALQEFEGRIAEIQSEFMGTRH